MRDSPFYQKNKNKLFPEKSSLLYSVGISGFSLIKDNQPFPSVGKAHPSLSLQTFHPVPKHSQFSVPWFTLILFHWDTSWTRRHRTRFLPLYRQPVCHTQWRIFLCTACLSLQLGWNTDMVIHLCAVYGCFQPCSGKGHGNCRAQNMSLSGPLERELCQLWSYMCFHFLMMTRWLAFASRIQDGQEVTGLTE